MSFYLLIIDSAFATDQYVKAKKHFFSKAFGFKICREFPKGVNAARDVDSGPIIFGASLSDTGFITEVTMEYRITLPRILTIIITNLPRFLAIIFLY